MRLPRTGALVDTLRLASGLALFLFALTHFLNHALGIWSLEAMATAQGWRLAVTRSWPGAAVLAMALVIHLGLALWRIARLKTWRLPAASLWLLVTGGLISILVMPHFWSAGIGPRVAGARLSYAGGLSLIWPNAMVLQSALMVLVWGHGCLGLHAWLKSEPWWRRGSHVLAALAALVPAAALAGVVVAGRQIERLTAIQPIPLPYSQAVGLVWVARAAEAERISLALIALAFAVAFTSWLLARRRRLLAISYLPGPKEIGRAHV